MGPTCPNVNPPSKAELRAGRVSVPGTVSVGLISWYRGENQCFTFNA